MSAEAKRFVKDVESALRKIKREKFPPGNYEGTPLEYLGLYHKQVEEVAKSLRAKLPEDWVTALDELWKSPVFEARCVAIDLASREKKRLEKKHWSLFSKWIEDCVGWALVDGLCCDLLSLFIVRWPELVTKTEPWVRSKNLWKRRASLVILTRPAREGMFAQELFARATVLSSDHDPMIYKAVSWVLRSAIDENRKEVEKFLREHDGDLHRSVIREVTTKLKTGRKTAKAAAS
jgi:3-methyladenine DNA glycosylase AlkD